jgi:hypothetical protein
VNEILVSKDGMVVDRERVLWPFERAEDDVVKEQGF